MMVMCHAADAGPPLPPIMGGSSDDGDLILTASDGNRFAAYAARAAQPNGAGIIVMPDAAGLGPFYKDLARRFAQAGVDAVAMDYFGRSAGIGERPQPFDYRPHIGQTTPAGVAADVAAAIAHLTASVGGSPRSIFTAGFCFGGGQSWRQSAEQPALSGAIGLYGIPSRARDAIPRMKAPLLLLLGGADQATTPQDFARFEREVTEAGVPHKTVVYEGAPHSFFDRTFEQHRAAAEDAWLQMLAFIGEHTRQPAHA